MWQWRRGRDPRLSRLARRYGTDLPPDDMATQLVGAGGVAGRVLAATGAVWRAPEGAPTPTRDDILDAVAVGALANVREIRAELDAEAMGARMTVLGDIMAAMDPVLTAHVRLEAIQAGLVSAAVRADIPRDALTATWYHVWTRDAPPPAQAAPPADGT
ncbi:hypothetical protein [Candidatus Frankia alpina]|uniref:Uncharacterized protein n=1 Tax=Candidatus Frankia alpina TaxID=2699483 RepID=A0A4S5ESF8_9ACTN|nr:hypothetical protein [Candidatus Frankia alpina]THJ75377.1 hypothetical protein E7Y31_05765 [Candidatus Frankia alpina]